MFKDGSSLKHTELLSDTGVDSPYQPLAQTDGVLLLRYIAQFVGSSNIQDSEFYKQVSSRYQIASCLKNT
jgi:hypothetical protein